MSPQADIDLSSSWHLPFIKPTLTFYQVDAEIVTLSLFCRIHLGLYGTELNDCLSFLSLYVPFSTKREAVLHSAHSEEALGAEEKAWDLLCAAVLLHSQPKSSSYHYCCSKAAHRLWISTNISILWRCDCVWFLFFPLFFQQFDCTGKSWTTSAQHLIAVYYTLLIVYNSHKRPNQQWNSEHCVCSQKWVKLPEPQSSNCAHKLLYTHHGTMLTLWCDMFNYNDPCYERNTMFSVKHSSTVDS